MTYLPLTRGRVSLLDEESFTLVRSYKWGAHYTGKKWYASRHRREFEYREGIKLPKVVFLHRFLTGLLLISGKAIVVDHIDGNGLNNTMNNLRVCSFQSNAHNKGRTKNCSSRFKGVCTVIRKSSIAYQAYISYNSQRKHIGTFDDELDAAKAYDVMAVKYFGEYARLNFGDVPF